MSIIGLVSLVIGFACVPFAHTILAVAGITVLFGFGMALASNGITAQISNAATSREQGTVLGVGSSLDSLSGIIAPPISTGILAQFGSPYAGVASIVMATVSLILGIRNMSIQQPVEVEVEGTTVIEVEATT
jgi:MFS family permease